MAERKPGEGQDAGAHGSGAVADQPRKGQDTAVVGFGDIGPVVSAVLELVSVTVPQRELRLRGSYEDAVRLVSADRDRRGGGVERLIGRPAGTFARRALGYAAGFR